MTAEQMPLGSSTGAWAARCGPWTGRGWRAISHLCARGRGLGSEARRAQCGPPHLHLVWDRDWKDTRNRRQGDGPHCEQSSQQPAGQGLCMHTLSHGRPVPNPHDTCMCTGYTGAPRQQHSAVLSPCPRLSQGRGASNRAALLVPPPPPDPSHTWAWREALDPAVPWSGPYPAPILCVLRLKDGGSSHLTPSNLP